MHRIVYGISSLCNSNFSLAHETCHSPPLLKIQLVRHRSSQPPGITHTFSVMGGRKGYSRPPPPPTHHISHPTHHIAPPHHHIAILFGHILYNSFKFVTPETSDASLKNSTAGNGRSGGCWCRYKVQQPLQNSVNEHIRFFITRGTRWGY